MRLRDKVAVVTGSTRGKGKKIIQKPISQVFSKGVQKKEGAMTDKMKVFLVVLLGAVILFPLCVCADEAFVDKSKLPKIITLTSYPMGAHGGFLATTFSDAIEKKTGIKVRPLPADADLGRFLPVKAGEAEAAVVSGGTVHVASNGLLEFSSPQWGPQKIRLVFAGDVMPHGMAVRASSGIKTWDDLKGKRVAMAPGVFSITTPGFLAYGGLTLDDVVVRKASGYTTAVRMVMSDGADACHVTPLSPLLKEWEAAPYGLRYLPFDPENKAGWERMRKIAPFLAVPVWVEKHALGEGGPKWLCYYPYTIATYDTADEYVIYAIVKALVEGRDIYKGTKPPSTEQFTLERTLSKDMPVYVPFHPGLIRYAKEVGKWTPELEARQAESLKAEEERIKNWKAKQ